MAISASSFASARFSILRLVFGSELSRSISLPIARLSQSVVERRIAEVGECLGAAGEVEGPVAVMRHRARARSCFDVYFLPAFHFYDFFCDVHERMYFPRRNIEHAGAAAVQNPLHELRHVVDEDVVEPLLALAEEHDVL